jgi:hypothetical protein
VLAQRSAKDFVRLYSSGFGRARLHSVTHSSIENQPLARHPLEGKADIRMAAAPMPEGKPPCERNMELTFRRGIAIKLPK